MQQILIFVLLGMVLQSTEGSTLRVSYCPPNEPTNLENLLKSFGDILKEKVWSFEQRMKQLEKQQNTFLETLSARLENQLTWKSNVQTQGSQTSDNRTKEENMSNTDTQAVVTEQTWDR
ncbi:uncharacterized protein Dere_GG26961 [Drosophila erecta]|uniref:Uncharacterized protein n=1 Tax=Drosophila erecta TaxID=7220 RepID=A0A0Q5WB50_DROER|nr:uncharacterized protein Dere_GG26961 [Drosophila erecta]